LRVEPALDAVLDQAIASTCYLLYEKRY
jgi:hypothetical protein